jgi:hypothetical protein
MQAPRFDERDGEEDKPRCVGLLSNDQSCGEEALARFSENRQQLCLPLALWNGRERMLKEHCSAVPTAEAVRRHRSHALLHDSSARGKRNLAAERAMILTAAVARVYADARSANSAPGAFFITDSIPLSRAASDSYISLLPITWWLAAFRAK